MGAVMKSSTGSVSGARYTTTVIESAVTPLAVAPPLSFALAKHSCVKKYGSATWPVLRSQVEGNVRSVRFPFWLNGIAPSGRVPFPDAPLDVEPDAVAVGFLSSLFPATSTAVAMIAMTTTMAAIGPYRRRLLPRSGPDVALLGCMLGSPYLEMELRSMAAADVPRYEATTSGSPSTASGSPSAMTAPWSMAVRRAEI